MKRRAFKVLYRALEIIALGLYGNRNLIKRAIPLKEINDILEYVNISMKEMQGTPFNLYNLYLYFWIF